MSNSSLDIYLIAIGGTGMAPLACLLKGEGFQVRGSDEALYPPMSTLLREAGIEPEVGFSPRNLDRRPDLVVVGNAVPRTNPEAQFVEETGIERISMPQALWRFFLADRKPLVIAGTHGKTTTTAIASWLYTDAGHDPGFLVGGVPRNLEQSFACGTGKRFVVEGDEYNAAYFDRGPKFFHYRPDTLILTSVEHDHADLYPTHATLLDTYRKLVELVPESGLLIAYGDSDDVREVASSSRCHRMFYGLDERNDFRPEQGWTIGPAGAHFVLTLEDRQPIELHLPLPGEHNLVNALAVIAAAQHDGIAASDIARALSRFEGVKRRQEVVGRGGGVLVIDDFAHHPTAVSATLDALRASYPDRRLCVALEPRSLTASSKLFSVEYFEALRKADLVFLAPVFHATRFSEDDRLDTAALAEALRKSGISAEDFDSTEKLQAEALESLQPGDLFVTMSSGSFGRLPQNVAEALSEAGVEEPA